MVAYSFRPFFAAQIEAGIKKQTLRQGRRRHARPGERIQLYTGMRTRQCRKLVDPDPVCVDVQPVTIVFGERISAIFINLKRLTANEMEAFACVDGFSPQHLASQGFDGKTALDNMSAFWAREHVGSPFTGELIRWEFAL